MAPAAAAPLNLAGAVQALVGVPVNAAALQAAVQQLYTLHANVPPLQDLLADLNAHVAHLAGGLAPNGAPTMNVYAVRLLNLAYMAGLLDAEGSIAFGRGGAASVTISQSNPLFLLLIRHYYFNNAPGVTLSRQASKMGVQDNPGITSNGHLNWVLHISAVPARALLTAVLPFLRRKHQQVALGLAVGAAIAGPARAAAWANYWVYMTLIHQLFAVRPRRGVMLCARSRGVGEESALSPPCAPPPAPHAAGCRAGAVGPSAASAAPAGPGGRGHPGPKRQPGRHGAVLPGLRRRRREEQCQDPRCR